MGTQDGSQTHDQSPYPFLPVPVSHWPPSHEGNHSEGPARLSAGPNSAAEGSTPTPLTSSVPAGLKVQEELAEKASVAPVTDTNVSLWAR